MVQSVTVRMYETYDMSTALSKLGLIAIKTPSAAYINKRYPGLQRQFKFVSLDSCDIVLSCASSLPADPLQIGTIAGKISPQDMFNPLLYTACSNDSWNGILNRIYGTNGSFSSGSGTVKQFADAFPGRDAFSIYYSLLGENKFKKAYVQAGLSMRGLVPLVYPVLTPNGQNANLIDFDAPTTSNFNDIWGTNQAGDSPGKSTNPTVNGGALIKGTAQHMPRIQTKVYTSNPGDETVTQVVPQVQLGGVPVSYVACIIVPPARIQVTYFRMTICWQATFSVLESDLEIGLTPTLVGTVNSVYANTSVASSSTLKADELSDYTDTSVNADDGEIHRSVVADGVTLDLVMEK